MRGLDVLPVEAAHADGVGLMTIPDLVKANRIEDELCDCGHRLTVHLDYGDPSYPEWKCEECRTLAWHEFKGETT